MLEMLESKGLIEVRRFACATVATQQLRETPDCG